MRSVRLELRSVCQGAISGSIKVEGIPDFDDRSLTPFEQQVLSDIEDGVEHFPGHLFSGQPDYTEWHRSENFAALRIDVELLDRTDLSDGELLVLREKCLVAWAEAAEKTRTPTPL